MRRELFLFYSDAIACSLSVYLSLIFTLRILYLADADCRLRQWDAQGQGGFGISLGARSLQFHIAPVVRLPEMMVTWAPKRWSFSRTTPSVCSAHSTVASPIRSLNWTTRGTKCTATMPALWVNTAFPSRRAPHDGVHRADEVRPRLRPR